ncbi:hypothetical protein D3C78_1761410 [compost metagenome]
MTVADGRLRHLRDQCLGVAQHQQQQLAMAIEFVFETLPRQAVGISGTLHNCTTWRAFTAHEHRDTDQPLIAYHGNLR